MKFDSNRAWTDAVAAVNANRHVLLPLAGVFFLLPTLLSTVFLGEMQARMMGAMGKPEQVERIFLDHLGSFLGFGIGGMVVQGIGYLAAMVLLGDRARPTVGEAIAVAFRALPTLIAAFVLSMAGLMMAALVLGGTIGGLSGLLGGAGLASVAGAVAVLLLMVYVWVRLSLLVPVVVSEGFANPVAALRRSWQLTAGNSLRLCGFFVLLGVGYMALALAASLLVLGPVALLAGEGQVMTMVTGVVSGVIGAASSVILVAVLTQAHRQLADTRHGEVWRTFE